MHCSFYFKAVYYLKNPICEAVNILKVSCLAYSTLGAFFGNVLIDKDQKNKKLGYIIFIQFLLSFNPIHRCCGTFLPITQIKII